MAGVVIDQGDTVIVTSSGGNVTPVANANALESISATAPVAVSAVTSHSQTVSLTGLSGFGTALQVVRVNGAGNALEYGTPAAGYTTEEAQDAVGAMVDSSLVYVDATPLLTRAALTGDVTASQGSNATTIANGVVTNAKAANMATATFKGRNTAGTGSPEDLSVATAQSMLGLGAQPAVAKTANYTLLASDHGKMFTNEGAGGLVRFTLPTWADGLIYKFTVYEPAAVRIFDATGSNIFKGSVSADRWESSTPGVSITVEATASPIWTVTAVVNDADWV